MALKNSVHKIQSSLANFIFANRGLIDMWAIFDYKQFIRMNDPIVKNENDYIERLEAIRVSVLISHIEILKQSFFEYIQWIKPIGSTPCIEELDDLGRYLFDLRNAFNHSRGELIPKFSEKIKKKLITVIIPVTKIGKLFLYDPKSKYAKKFVLNRQPSQKIRADDIFINKICILSYHILHITKRKKIATLEKYLGHVKDLPKIK